MSRPTPAADEHTKVRAGIFTSFLVTRADDSLARVYQPETSHVFRGKTGTRTVAPSPLRFVRHLWRGRKQQKVPTHESEHSKSHMAENGTGKVRFSFFVRYIYCGLATLWN